MQQQEFKGRGAGINPQNQYLKHEYVQEHLEMLDEPLLSDEQTTFIHERPKKVVNKISSPDVGMEYSLNPYQGCEHGCVYCYARNSHQYWGFSAGLDFERRIVVKENAPELLEQLLRKKSWVPKTISLSGNTDCYQPIERKLKITRRILQVFLKYRHPVGIITKNSMILRDLDILQELAERNLVRTIMTINSLDEGLRRKMEPRTATSRSRLRAIEGLAKAGIPVTLMVSPLIPGLNTHEIPEVIKAGAAAGAKGAYYVMIRLNGAIGDIFKDWLEREYPDRAQKVLHQIQSLHGGNLSDSRFGTRMRGEGNIADSVRSLFKVSVKRFMEEPDWPKMDFTQYRKKPEVLSLFD